MSFDITEIFTHNAEQGFLEALHARSLDESKIRIGFVSFKL